MARILPKKDVVIMGLGWTGSILAQELTDEGLDVMAIERGPWRDPPPISISTYAQDELRYPIRQELFLRPDQTTMTIRNKMDQTGAADARLGLVPAAERRRRRRRALERRRPGASCPATSCSKTHLTQRYGASACPKE